MLRIICYFQRNIDVVRLGQVLWAISKSDGVPRAKLTYYLRLALNIGIEVIAIICKHSNAVALT